VSTPSSTKLMGLIWMPTNLSFGSGVVMRWLSPWS